MCHFRNAKWSFVAGRFRPNSSLNPRNKDVIIETYVSCLEERWQDIKNPSKRLTILQRKNWRLCITWKMTLALSLKKLTWVLLSLPETERHIDSLMTEKCMNKFQITWVSCQHFCESIRKNTSPAGIFEGQYWLFLIKDPKFLRFYLILNIHKQLRDLATRQKVKLYIKNSSHFLIKLSVGKLHQGAILCTIVILIELAKIVPKDNTF